MCIIHTQIHNTHICQSIHSFMYQTMFCSIFLIFFLLFVLFRIENSSFISYYQRLFIGKTIPSQQDRKIYNITYILEKQQQKPTIVKVNFEYSMFI